MASPTGSAPCPSEVSLVFQGSIGSLGSDARTIWYRALESARKCFPGAEIILSTWKGTVCEEFGGIKVVECEDPGPIESRGRELLNLNRQIVSSQEGLALCTRPWAVKLRTDMLFRSGALFDTLGKVAEPVNGVTRKRVIALTTTSRNPHRAQPYPFMVCDWLYAGLTEDIKDIWDIPLYPDNYVDYFDEHSRPENDPSISNFCRYYAEAYIWQSFLRKCMWLEFEHSSDNRPAVVELSERLIAHNLILISPRQAGVDSLKYTLPMDYHDLMYTHRDWLLLLNQYSIPHSFRVPLLDREWVEFWIRHRLGPKLKWVWDWLTWPGRGLSRRLGSLPSSLKGREGSGA